ncbi:methyl-accepting chemotaxis protein [Bdellovibrio sp. SKB1291214]|uniref:methyl-accepting chemotaxis protein n=1 Tax=Bdellovibrio sp. SKB1291214 TaxID=1732569 RepID=UPI00223FBBFB|nr:methyl-accepting chemotaxis protein [Bdellovibrio sp. SKB1291214]UYL10187.1 methyl-accepting chemotaxis protein [Bdellovibrio sp. SKB1291214]
MKNRSLNFKMMFVIGILLMGSLTITTIGLLRLKTMNDSIKALVYEKSARVSLIKDIRSIFYIQLINEKNFILVDDAKELAVIEDRMNKRNDEIMKKITELSSVSTELGKEELNKFKVIYEGWWANAHEIRKAVHSSNHEHASKISSVTNRELRLNGENLIDSTVDRNEKRMQEEVIHMEEQYKEARFMMILMTVLSMLIGGSIAGYVLYNLSKSINLIISSLSISSKEVSAASDQIATAATELSEATTEQAASLEESVATIEELSSMVKTNSENASSAAKLSAETSDLAKRGETEMTALSQSMTDIAADSKKINDIIAVIDDIAFQTNLLALNAAVEAARAGEQGKGFAVVAEAVRALSQRSSAAAKDIGDLIRSSVTRIDNGGEQAQRSAAVLVEILNSVKKVSALNTEISAASSEQSNGIEQISKAMNQLDQTTQVNAASSEEAAASSEELAAQAESMGNVIQELVKAIRGQSSKAEQEIVPKLERKTLKKHMQVYEKAS